MKYEYRKAPERFSKRNNYWYVPPQKSKENHPAVFPEKLAHDHIVSWSNKGDIVYDPFSGSGTVAKMCIKLRRKFIGSEINSEYYKASYSRLRAYVSQLKQKKS